MLTSCSHHLSLATLPSTAAANRLNICQLNVRGINEVNKFNEIRLLLGASPLSLDVIVLFETKLRQTFPLKLYSFPGFNLFSCSRAQKNDGGVMVYVRQSLVSKSTQLPPVSFERLSINIYCGGSCLRLLGFYRAPGSSNLNEFLNELDTTLTDCATKTMLVGDINIGVPNFIARTLPLDASSRTYLDLLASYGFAVTNFHPTRPGSGKTLDNFATNFHESLPIHNYTVETDPKISDHSIVISTVTLESNNPRAIGCVSRS